MKNKATGRYSAGRRIAFLLFFFIAASGYGQNIASLDGALQNAFDYFRERIPPESKVLTLDFVSESGELSDYIVDELTARIVNSGAFTVVDRTNLAYLQEELKFQLSGEVSDDTAVSVGRKLGAESIILGSIKPLGDIYRLHARTIEVETAKIQGMINFNIAQDPILAALTGKTFSGSQSRWLANQAFGNELWKNKRFYAGARPGFSLRFYDLKNGEYSAGTANNGIVFDIAAQFAVQAHQLFALQTEVIVSADSAAISRTENILDSAGNLLYRYETIYGFSSRSMTVPVLAKLTLRPDVFSFSVFAGAYLSFPLGSIDYSDSRAGLKEKRTGSPNPDWAAGAGAGIKLGPGSLFLDMRYMADFNRTQVRDGGGISEIYKRGMAVFGIGYEIGFANLKKRG